MFKLEVVSDNDYVEHQDQPPNCEIHLIHSEKTPNAYIYFDH